LLSYKDFESKNIEYNLLEGELSILKQLGELFGKNFGKIWGKLLFPLSKTILFLCFPKIRKYTLTFNTIFCVLKWIRQHFCTYFLVLFNFSSKNFKTGFEGPTSTHYIVYCLIVLEQKQMGQNVDPSWGMNDSTASCLLWIWQLGGCLNN
jgi:hypothetical protein